MKTRRVILTIEVESPEPLSVLRGISELGNPGGWLDVAVVGVQAEVVGAPDRGVPD